MDKQSLTSNQSHLIEIMQRLNFGHIEGLVVRDGEPVFERPFRAIRLHKFGGENGPRVESALGNFALKDQVRELLDVLTEIGDGVIERIEVRHGLPISMTVPQPVDV